MLHIFSRICCIDGLPCLEEDAEEHGLDQVFCCCAPTPMSCCGVPVSVCTPKSVSFCGGPVTSCYGPPRSSCCQPGTELNLIGGNGIKRQTSVRETAMEILIPPSLEEVHIRDLPGPKRPKIFKSAATENTPAVAPTVMNWPETKDGKALSALKRKRPYIAIEGHYLYRRFIQCIDAIQEKSADASDIVERLTQETDMEEEALAMTYEFFRSPESEKLRHMDVRRMLNYLGKPAEKADVDNLISTFDEDSDYTLNIEMFSMWVGNMGGSSRLFAVRKISLFGKNVDEFFNQESEGLIGRDETLVTVAQLGEEMKEAGFEDKECLYWRLMLPISESRAVSNLKGCQKKALLHIRNLARKNHNLALGKLQRRMLQLGCAKDDLWNTLAWIRECAPIIIQLNLDTMASPMNVDTHYRNQFETDCSNGLMNVETRKIWETRLFNGAYDGPEVKPFDRVKYGVINVMYDHRGVARTEAYGDSYMVLKDVRLRCTFTPQDSANLSSSKLAVLDYFAHELIDYTDAELKEVVRVATSTEPVVGNSCVVEFLKYKEAQIHGEVSFANDVERIVAHDRHRTGYHAVFLQEVCDKHGIELCWMSDEKSRMEQERSVHMSPTRYRPKRRSLFADDGDSKASSKIISDGHSRD